MKFLLNHTAKATNWVVVAAVVLAVCSLVAIGAKPALAVDTISSAKYLDNNNDGTVDHIRWTMDENVVTCAYNGADWSVDVAGTVGVTGITGIACTGSDAYLDIAVTVSTTNTTGGSTDPQISYTNNSSNVMLTSGGLSTKPAVPATDGAKPIVVSAVISNDGFYNVITLVYSERMHAFGCGVSPSTSSVGDMTTAGTLAGFGSFATTGDVAAVTAKNDIHGSCTNTIEVKLAESDGGYLTHAVPTGTEPSGVFTPATEANIFDDAGLEVNAAHTVVSGGGGWDITMPALSSITDSDEDLDGVIDRATLVFDSPIRDSNFVDGNASFINGAHTGTGAFVGDGGPNDTHARFNVTGGDLPVDTSANADFIYTGAGDFFITDKAGNLINTATPGTIASGDAAEIDGAKPVLENISIANNATRNYFVFTYSEPVTLHPGDGASSPTLGDVDSGNIAGIGAFGNNGDVSVPTGLNTLSGSGTSTIVLILADQAGGYINSTSTTEPSGSFFPDGGANVTDVTGNHVYTISPVFIAVHGGWNLVKPTISSVTISDAQNANGRVDRATIVFSKSMRDASFTDADGELYDVTHVVTGSGTFDTGAADDNTTAFNLTTDNLPIDTSATAANFTYSGATTKITDIFGNLLNADTYGEINASDATELDGAAPVPVSAIYIDSAHNGTIDGVNVLWSEDLVVSGEAGDHVFNGTSAFGAMSVTGIGYTGSILNLSVSPANAGITGSAAPLTYTYTDQGTLGSLHDAAGNASVTAAPVTVGDAAPPVILSAKYLDTNPTNGTVDTVRFTTSADTGINSASFAGDTDFTVSNAGSVALTSDVLDSCSSNGTNRFDISLHTPGALRVTGGADVPTVNYNQPGGGVQDGSGNDVPSAALVGVDDGAAPMIEQASYIDSNHDGAVDGVILFTTVDTSLACGSFTGDADFTVTTPGSVGLSTDGADHCSTNNINQFIIALNDPGTLNVTGGLTDPVVNYTQPSGGFADGAGNEVSSAALVAASDAAAPVPVTARYFDADHNGIIDEVDVNWSEDIYYNEFEAGDHVFNGSSAFGAVTATGLDYSGNTLAVYVSPDNSGVTGSSDPLTYTYTDQGTGGSVRDANFITAVTSGALTAIDNAAPVVLSAKYMDLNVNGTIDHIRVHLSADTGTVLSAYNASDWSLPATGVFSDMTVTGAAMNGANDVDVAVSTGYTDRTGSATAVTITYTNNGNRLHDGASNNTPTAAGVTAADGAPPLLYGADYEDTNHDGTIDTVEAGFTFDTGLAATYNTADWSFPTPGSVVNLNDTNAAVGSGAVLLTVSSTAHVTGGGSSPTLTYTNNLNRVHDGAGNATPSLVSAVTVSDSASPVIVSVSPADSATNVAATAPVVVDFSETMTPPGFMFPNCTFTTSPDPGGYLTASPVIINPGTDSLWSAGANGLASSRVTLTHSVAYAAGAHVTASIANCTANNAATAVNPGVPASWSFTIHAASSGGGGGGGSSGVVSSPSIVVNTPGGGGTYAPGAVLGLGWTPANGSFVKYKVSYSTDNGANWVLASDNVTSTATSWTIPNIATVLGKIKVDGYASGSNLLATGVSSGNFTITGTGTTPPPPLGTTTPPPATDSTATGSYSPALALANTPDINTDKGLTAPPVGTTVYCTAGTLIKGSLSAVYYCGKDGKRYVFVNDKAFFTWYDDFSSVITISDTDLAKIPLGGNITYRPGKRMIKVQSDPRVYVISRGGILRWVSSEAVALQLFGPNWATMIDDISDAFFVNYTMGPQL